MTIQSLHEYNSLWPSKNIIRKTSKLREKWNFWFDAFDGKLFLFYFIFIFGVYMRYHTCGNKLAENCSEACSYIDLIGLWLWKVLIRFWNYSTKAKFIMNVSDVLLLKLEIHNKMLGIISFFRRRIPISTRLQKFNFLLVTQFFSPAIVWS